MLLKIILHTRFSEPSLSVITKLLSLYGNNQNRKFALLMVPPKPCQILSSYLYQFFKVIPRMFVTNLVNSGLTVINEMLLNTSNQKDSSIRQRPAFQWSIRLLYPVSQGLAGLTELIRTSHLVWYRTSTGKPIKKLFRNAFSCIFRIFKTFFGNN